MLGGQHDEALVEGGQEQEPLVESPETTQPQLQLVPDKLLSYITYKGSMLDLFNISFQSRVDLFMYEVPKQDIITKESMLDWSAYQEVKLVTKLIDSLGSDLLLTC